MAFNEILSGRLNRYAQKLLVIKNTALHGFTPELMMVLPIFSGVEDRYLQGWGRYALETVTAAVAAVQSGSQVRNPVGSNLVVVIEKLTLQTVTAGGFVISQAASTVDLPSSGTGFRQDSRNNPNSSALFSQSTAAGTTSLANVILRMNSAANLAFDVIITQGQELLIMPGDTVRWVNNTPNEALLASLIWRERSLESSELT
jgi:hypothetical protein